MIPSRLTLGLMAVGIVAFGQENYGSISGVVLDASSASVPGALVEITGGTLPRGVIAATDIQGRYLLPRVQNGEYTLTVSKPGFSKFIQHNIEVYLGAALVFNVNLKVGEVAEVVEVNESSAQLDLISSATSTNIPARVFDNLPKGRQFHTLLIYAPGVRFEPKNGNQGVGAVQVDGASGAENAFLLDGVDISDVRRGVLRPQNAVPFEFLSELQIKSGGFAAEYGGAMGGVVSVTTRGGSNGFHGMGLLHGTGDPLNPSPHAYWKRSVRSADVAQFFQPLEDSYRNLYPGVMIGGPVLKDKLFFNAAYMPQMERRERTVPYASGARSFGRDDTFHYGLGRLDFNPTAKLQTYGSWIWSPWKRIGTLPNADPLVAAPANNLAIQGGFQPAQNLNGGLSYSVTPHWLVSARTGYQFQNEKGTNYGLSGAPFLAYNTSTAALPANLLATVPAELRQGTGFTNVSSTFGILFDETSRKTLNLDSSHLLNLGKTQHQFKFGYGYARIGNKIEDDYTNGRFGIFWNESFTSSSLVQNQRGTYGYYIWNDGPRHKAAVNSRNQGFYFQDDFRATQKLTFHLGVRLENEFLPPYTPEVNGIKVANPVKFGWVDKVAPRLGLAWNPGAAGKWKIAGSFGIYFDVLKYELARSAFGGTLVVSHVYRLDNPNLLALGKATPGAGGTQIIQTNDAVIPVNSRGELEGIDPGIKPYSSREFTGTLSRQLKPDLIFTVRYVRKELLRAIEDMGVLDKTDNTVYLIGNPGFGQTRNTTSVYAQKTPDGREFLVPKAVRQYDAVELRLQGNYFKRLNVMTSYTWSRLYGNYSGLANSDESGRSDPSISRAFDLPYYYFDASGSQRNVLGRLGTDSPHAFKSFINYDLKTKAGRTILGINQFAYSGVPDSTTIIYLSAPTFPYGRGDMGRVPVFTKTDLSVIHEIPIRERVKMRLEANVTNLLNQAVVVSRVTQINRASVFVIPTTEFFKGYDPNRYLSPPAGPGRIPRNPIYGYPGGQYAAGGEGALTAPGTACCGGGGYQFPREVRLGLRLMF